jgi:hypothetical protein
MTLRSNLLHTVTALGIVAFVGCESTSSTKPAESFQKVSAAQLPASVLADTRTNVGDVMDRLIPALGNVAAESSLRVNLASYQSSLANGDAAAAERSLTKVEQVLTKLSETTGASASAQEIDAVRIALHQAERALTTLKKVQTEDAQ